MKEFKDESRLGIREMRQQWGELSRKLGTMAEDLVAPSVPRILRTFVNCPGDVLDKLAVRERRVSILDRSKNQEFDVVAVCGGYLFLNETKSSLRTEDIRIFAEETQPAARYYFPEYDSLRIIGSIGTLYMDDSMRRYGERLGLIMLGFGENVMDVLNSSDFKPKEF